MNKIISLIVGGILVLVSMIIVITFLIIYRDVKKVCVNAQKKYKKSYFSSLIKTIRSENSTHREKNSAVWVLGQLADKNSLEFLYELNKSLPEQKNCNYDMYLCKYEVEKAIRWSKNGNITSWMYKTL